MGISSSVTIPPESDWCAERLCCERRVGVLYCTEHALTPTELKRKKTCVSCRTTSSIDPILHRRKHCTMCGLYHTCHFVCDDGSSCFNYSASYKYCPSHYHLTCKNPLCNKVRYKPPDKVHMISWCEDHRCHFIDCNQYTGLTVMYCRDHTIVPVKAKNTDLPPSYALKP